MKTFFTNADFKIIKNAELAAFEFEQLDNEGEISALFIVRSFEHVNFFDGLPERNGSHGKLRFGFGFASAIDGQDVMWIDSYQKKVTRDHLISATRRVVEKAKA